ncbi:MFS transporter [Ktedonosporobacter rubrisoli]|uniref:MFS transporter n=1 Tax=Ktedonosporobacter rubrisoli TaxID=2509675 RepID=A0A4V0YYQ8_KTERU|nr:MFS transporter [Ktedonosporobacter rubrisoli]QBD77071.1 MFS transporter [Ktedonosporobacter rubrisoli]
MSPIQNKQDNHATKQATWQALSLWHNRNYLLLWTGGINFIFPDSSTLLVIVMLKQQHAPPTVIGLVLSIGSIGYLTGTLLSRMIQRRIGVGPIVIATCWLFMFFWLLYLVPATIPNLALLAGVTVLTSLVDPIYDITQFSYRAARIPDKLQGRVHSAYRLVALATPQLGLALTGLRLEYGNVPLTILTLAACLLLLAVVASFQWRKHNSIIAPPEEL